MNPPLFLSRLKIVTSISVLGLAIITLKLFHLQVNLGISFLSRARKNFLRCEKIISTRGNILDAKGRPLATNRPVTMLYWQGTGKRQLDPQQRYLITTLKRLFGEDQIDEALIISSEKKGKKVPLVVDIAHDSLSQLLEQFPSHKNIAFDVNYERLYPQGSVASHVVGYLGSLQAANSSGKMGLEKLFEDILKGSPGELITMVDSRGRPLGKEEVRKALIGKDIYTTIDLDFQKLAENAFPEGCSGAIVIMDPNNGALQAVLSRPAFDPNLFLRPLTNETWKALGHNQAFLNRALSACYPPASLFKLVTISAALETNLITPESEWVCRGHIMFGGRAYHCNNHYGHGRLNTKQALAQSCNIPLYEIAKRLKINTLADYAHRLGLGSPTHCILPEKAGHIPTREWKQQVKRERWFAGETLSAVLGQGFILVTPLQIACTVSGICEGYLVRPRFLHDEPCEQRPLDLSPDTLEFLKSCMVFVVSQGTARSLRKWSNIEIYAKTGTAQTMSLAASQAKSHATEHAWFAAWVRYKDNKPFTLVIVIEQGGSSQVAIKAANKYLSSYFSYMDTLASS